MPAFRQSIRTFLLKGLFLILWGLGGAPVSAQQTASQLRETAMAYQRQVASADGVCVHNRTSGAVANRQQVGGDIADFCGCQAEIPG